MAEPRCGIPDDVHPEVKKRKKRQASYGRGWRQKVITWRPTSYSRKLPIYKQWKTLKIAFQTWAQVIPRHFKYTTENPDIVIKFARGIHGDGYYNGFDGRGMTLAHAFRPGKHPMSGDTHFDDDEDWSRNGTGTATSPDLLAVATHEFGHAIGLDHSADYTSIMSPFFSASRTELTQSDIRAAQTIYGSKVIHVPPPRRRNSVTRTTSNNPGYSTTPKPRQRYITKMPTTTTTDNPRQNTIPQRRTRYRPRTAPDIPKSTLKKLSQCQGVDAMFMGQDGYVSVIANETLFQADRRSGSYQSFALRSIYPNAPLPKTKFWEWSLWNDDVIGRKQHNIKQFWKGVPSSPDAAVTWTDQAIYFVKNNMYYKVSQRTRRLSRRYPKRMPAPWMRDLCENN
ncbi:matrix metalloproteinase-24-like [Mizuhopecten yessoensis]|uniref:matrix metalloproteinase-24-like n=1 Tax=Mizuhopecten yessoensis TaxID=6573 RepID=UPI000B45D41C|nr:matrix metalloproteinase-24-like [Mizuhopecten yessoensis]